MELKERYQVEMPIVEAVHEVVDYGKNPKDVIGRLLKREMKDEF
jgi:glycerol-3-phosphate dehydrogenase